MKNLAKIGPISNAKRPKKTRKETNLASKKKTTDAAANTKNTIPPKTKKKIKNTTAAVTRAPVLVSIIHLLANTPAHGTKTDITAVATRIDITAVGTRIDTVVHTIRANTLLRLRNTSRLLRRKTRIEVTIKARRTPVPTIRREAEKIAATSISPRSLNIKYLIFVSILFF